PAVQMTQSFQAPAGSQLSFLLEQLLTQQEQSWQQGECILVEQLVTDHADVRASAEAMLELIINEAILREAHGKPAPLREFQQRFPDLAAVLHIQWEVDRALFNRLSTRRRQEDAAVAGTLSLGAGPRAASAASKAQRIGRYEIQAVLGKGGMGVAYRA